MTSNPYEGDSAEMRRMLKDPTINRNEHAVYAPRFMSILPTGRLRDGGVRRVLDFGCGAGDFTADVAHRLPRAEIIGADASPTLFDADAFGDDVRFVQWDGQSPLGMGKFDLIVSKMTLHYLSIAQLDVAVSHLTAMLADNGEFAVSAPFGDYEHVLMAPLATKTVREIGQTGVKAEMWDYAMIPAVLAAYIPPKYGYAVDMVNGASGGHKRANMLFYPKNKFRTVRRRLVRAGVSDGNYSWDMVEQLTDSLRQVGRYVVRECMEGR